MSSTPSWVMSASAGGVMKPLCVSDDNLTAWDEQVNKKTEKLSRSYKISKFKNKNEIKLIFISVTDKAILKWLKSERSNKIFVTNIKQGQNWQLKEKEQSSG